MPQILCHFSDKKGIFIMDRKLERRLLERIVLYGSVQEMFEFTMANDMISEEITKVQGHNPKALFVGIGVMNELAYKFLKKRIYSREELMNTSIKKFREEYFADN